MQPPPLVAAPSDQYVIQEYLAEGGMGAIYLGKKVGPGGFEKQVVLKQLLPELTSEPQFIELFLREARLTATLEHKNIVQTLDLVAAGRDYFMVMEWVRGADLRTLARRARRRRQSLPPQAGLYLGAEVAEALAYAQGRRLPDGRPLGLIHRDVSPSNILLSGDGEVKLSDFGIAKAATHRSVYYRVKGKVGYMSPEQARGEPLDGRSDIYSLAVCVWETVTSDRLFVADLLSTPSMIYSQPVPRVSERRPGLPRELDAVLDKALAKERDGRFSSAREFGEALRKVAMRHGLLYTPAEMASRLLAACGDDPQRWHSREVGEERRSGTELYQASEAAPATAAVEEPSASPLPDPPPREPPERLHEGTQLTSILRLEEQRRAALATDDPAADLLDQRLAPPPAPSEPQRPRQRRETRPPIKPLPELEGRPQRDDLAFGDEPGERRPPRRERATREHRDDDATRPFVAANRTAPAPSPPAPAADPEATLALASPREASPEERPLTQEVRRWLAESQGHRLAAAAIVALLVIVGIALGVVLSEPPPEHDDPPSLRP